MKLLKLIFLFLLLANTILFADDYTKDFYDERQDKIKFSVNFLYGSKQLDGTRWYPVDRQNEMGLEFSVKPKKLPFSCSLFLFKR